MRTLTGEEMLLVAGTCNGNGYRSGYCDPNYCNDDIYVNGGTGGGRGYWGGSGYWGDVTYGGGGGESPPPPPPPPPEEPNETPCVETSFTSGVSTHDANRAALAAANAIAGINDQGNEYSSIIYAINGQVHYTEPFSNWRTDGVNLLGGIFMVPDGAVILGVVHNHPDDPSIDDRIPSGSGNENGDDWSAYDRMQDVALPRGIILDGNPLLWIHTDQDNKTRPYDKTDKNSENPSCPLQK